jgi:uncharacterized membrane protein
MKKITLLDGAAFIVWLLPIAYLISVYPSLPESLPMHFGLNGKPDRYGNQNEFLRMEVILIGLNVGLYLLLKYLPMIDPKSSAKYSESVFQKIAFAVALFLSCLNISIIFSVTHDEFNMTKIVFPLVGMLIMFLGNMMYNIKPNYFVGIRTPWTLEDEDNWKATHRLAGKLWFVGGSVITLASLLPNEIGTVIFVSGVVVLALVPVIYSYVYFKKHQHI